MRKSKIIKCTVCNTNRYKDNNPYINKENKIFVCNNCLYRTELVNKKTENSFN